MRQGKPQFRMTRICLGRLVFFLLRQSSAPNLICFYQLKTGVELWTLSSTETNTIEINPDSGRFTLDYVLFTPDQASGYAGRTMMSDDHDSTIKYSAGQWSLTESVRLPRAVPMKGTLAKATAVGASFGVQFTGE